MLDEIVEWVYANPRLTMTVIVMALFVALGLGLSLADYWV